MSFNGQRLTVARQRRGHTKKSLASLLDVTARAIIGWETGDYPPEPHHLDQLVKHLGYSASFFEGDDLNLPAKEAVSFRSMSRMKAAQRDATISACAIAQSVSEWVDQHYTLPKMDIPDLREDSPEIAASTLRQYWKLGQNPVHQLVHLLEAKGIRVFSLSQNCVEVDACSIWISNQPFVFLNTFKSAERSRFDAAHELGHLVLHKHGAPNGQEAERDANTFARHFLMPGAAVRADAPRIATISELIKKKKVWNVSLAALTYHYWKLGLLSDWNYKGLAIEIQSRGYRLNEPNGSQREQSMVWKKLLSSLREEGKGKAWLADVLNLPISEISELLFGLVTSSVENNSDEFEYPSSPRRGHLRLVSDNDSKLLDGKIV